MRLVQHYNDLTEICGLRYSDIGENHYYSQGDCSETLAKLETQIKTRIAFTDVKSNYPETIKMMDKAGWKVAKRTLDWHKVHKGDHEVRLYYKIFPDNKSDLTDKRTRQTGTYPDHHSLSGSCSMGLIDNLGKDWLQSPGYPERYLTLIRLTRKRTKQEVAKMKYFRYSLVFESDIARYFANGWKFDDFLGRDEEKDWWKAGKGPKIGGFVWHPKEENAD